jgi:hypothetical protein
MRRRIAAAIVAAATIGLGSAIAFQNESSTTPVTEDETSSPQADAGNSSEAAPQEQAAAKRASGPPPVQQVTPMKDRVAVLGLLNKRNGIWRDLKMHPGQAVRVGDVIVRLRACETTAPWEDQKLTGAFVQTDVLGADKKWRRIFSGWLFKESPSLNVVEHPIYDVWPKSCVMQYPDTGPDTVSAGSIDASRSKAPKSGEDITPAPEETPSATSNSAT